MTWRSRTHIWRPLLPKLGNYWLLHTFIINMLFFHPLLDLHKTYKCLHICMYYTNMTTLKCRHPYIFSRIDLLFPNSLCVWIKTDGTIFFALRGRSIGVLFPSSVQYIRNLPRSFSPSPLHALSPHLEVSSSTYRFCKTISPATPPPLMPILGGNF